MYSEDEQIKVDTNTVLAATVVCLHALKELRENKRMQNLLNPAAITHPGGLHLDVWSCWLQETTQELRKVWKVA